MLEIRMTDFTSLLGFAFVSLGMVLTPGPNMIYLISRSISQGHRAGFISLAGVASGFLIYMISAAFGITGILLKIPYAFDILRATGAVYLLYLAWAAIKPGGRSAFQVQNLKKDSDRRLFVTGLVTNLLNPKIALMYVALLPQFITAANGRVLEQALGLGLVQILISVSINSLVVLTAGSVAVYLQGRPRWLLVQRWFMATVLIALAVWTGLSA